MRPAEFLLAMHSSILQWVFASAELISNFLLHKYLTYTRVFMTLCTRVLCNVCCNVCESTQNTGHADAEMRRITGSATMRHQIIEEKWV